MRLYLLGQILKGNIIDYLSGSFRYLLPNFFKNTFIYIVTTRISLFYAGNGFINLHNNVGARELVGYKINLDQNAAVTYETGLANVNFSSGQSGGYAILSWREIAL